MNPLPQLSRGPDDGYTLFLDFYTVGGMELITADGVLGAFEAAWDLVSAVEVPAGPIIRLTTILPGLKGPWCATGLRPGEYITVRYVPNLPWRGDGVRGGVEIQPADRNPSLYLPNECYVVLGPPNWMGWAGVHEFGHCSLPTWPGSAQNGHTKDPRNVMYEGTIYKPSWYPTQLKLVAENLTRVRAFGVRLGGPVTDGGKPAWPLPTETR